jgi:hypothetical protein
VNTGLESHRGGVHGDQEELLVVRLVLNALGRAFDRGLITSNTELRPGLHSFAPDHFAEAIITQHFSVE